MILLFAWQIFLSGRLVYNTLPADSLSDTTEGLVEDSTLGPITQSHVSVRIMGPAGTRNKNDCAGEAQQQFT
jgi:hypothetical protein